MHPVVAHHLANPGPAQKSPEWYALRTTCLSASNVGQALGLSKYGKPEETMAKYLGFDKPMNPMGIEACAHGNDLEPEIRAWHERKLGENIHEFSLVKHPVHAWLGGSPDGISEKSGVLCEYKAPLRRKLIQGFVPPHYLAQIQTLLEVFDLETAHYVEYVPPSVLNRRNVGGELAKEPEVNFVVIERDRTWFAEVLPQLRIFWERVQLYRHHGPKLWLDELVPASERNNALALLLDKALENVSTLTKMAMREEAGEAPSKRKKRVKVEDEDAVIDPTIGSNDPTQAALSLLVGCPY